MKCIERLLKDSTKNNVFITGIPPTLDTGNGLLDTPETIIPHIISYVSPDTENNEYRFVVSFAPREGYTRHSAKLVFSTADAKRKVISNSKKLSDLEENNPLRKVFIKNESTPLTRKENERLYKKLFKLKEKDPDNRDEYKIIKGKLMCRNTIVDEFNIAKSFF